MSDQTLQEPNNGSTPSTTSPVIGDNRQADGKFGPKNNANPNGRPVGSVSITAAIKKKLEEKFPKKECFCSCHNNLETTKPYCVECKGFHEAQASFAEKKTYLESLVDVIMDGAIERKEQKVGKDIWSYVDGMPKGSFDVGVDREGLAELTEFMKALANPKKEQ